MTSRLTMNVGLRFDRYRSFLPEQEGPSGGRFTAATPTHYEEVSDVKTFNHPVPRIGLIFDVTGEGRTVIKANYAKYFWNPGTDISNNLNPNSQDYYTRRAWTDRDNDLLYDPGEEGNISQSFGGVGTTQLDPNLNNTYTTRDLRVGGARAVPRRRPAGRLRLPRDRRLPRPRQRQPADQRLQRADHAARSRTGRRRSATPTTAPNFQAFNLSAEALAAPVVNQLTNLDGKGEYQTVEFGVNKRQTGRWSLAALDVEAVEPGPRHHLLRPERPFGDDAVDAERPHQHRRWPVRVQHVDRQDQRQLRAPVADPGHARRCASSRDSPSAARSTPPPPTASAASAASTTARRAS